MPSRKRSQLRDRSPRPERDKPHREPRFRGVQREEEAFRLREQGKSFSAIARELEFNRTKDALEAYHRVLNRKPDEERGVAVERERERLDALEVRIRTRDVADPPKRDRRLAALDNLRNQL